MQKVGSALFKRYSVLGGVFLATFIVHYPTWSALASRWYNDPGSYSHGFLILALSVFLSFRMLDDSPYSVSSGSSFSFLVLLFGASSAWIVAKELDIVVAQGVLLPAIILASVGAVWGRDVFLRFLFPVLYLVFAIPIWWVFVEPLQQTTIAVVTAFLPSFGVTALVQNEFVHVPAGTFQIADGCAGLHFMFSAGAIGTLYAYFSDTTIPRKIFISLIFVSASIVMNWLRVLVIIIAGYRTNMQHFLVTEDHLSFGWLLFGISLIPTLLLVRTVDKPKDSDLQVVGELEPSERGSDQKGLERKGELRRAGIVALLFIGLPGFASHLFKASIDGEYEEFVSPELVDGWERQAARSSDWQPVFSGVETEWKTVYEKDEERIHVYANRYGAQSQGAELVNTDNSIKHSQYARLVSTEVRELPSKLPNGKLSVETSIWQRMDGERVAIWHWYQVGDIATASPIYAKLSELHLSISGGGVRGKFAVLKKCQSDCSAEAVFLSDFISKNAHVLTNGVRRPYQASPQTPI